MIGKKTTIILIVIGAIYFAWLFRWTIVPVAAGSGGSHEVNGSVDLGAYKLDRWTGEVTYYYGRKELSSR